jgi:transcriptional regulator with XRE-family HTH domain
MIIAERLRALREEKRLSQGEVESRTGLLRCYISRVEHGNTAPSVETLEKLARAFDMKLYQLLYDGPDPPEPRVVDDCGNAWGAEGRDVRLLDKLRSNLARMNSRDRRVLMATALHMARQRKKHL